MMIAGALQAQTIMLGPGRIQPGGPMIPAGQPHAVGHGKVATQPSEHLDDPGPPKADIAKIKADIRDLGSDGNAVPEKAASELVAMGEPVVPYLKAALQGMTTPEMRHWLRSDLRSIAKINLLRGPLITLDLKNVTAATAIMDVCKQAGTTANVFNNNTPVRISLNVKNAPFWKVIAILAQKTNLSPSYGYWNNSRQEISFSQGQNIIGAYTSFDGAFAVSLINSTYQRMCNYEQVKPSRSSSFTLQANLLMLTHETGNIQVQSIIITKAVDSKGQSLRSPLMNNYFSGPQTGPVANCNFILKYPAHPGRRIKLIQGYIPVIAAVGRKTYVVHLSTTKSERLRIAGMKVRFGPESLVNNEWQFTYVLSWPGMESPGQQDLQTQLANNNCMAGQASNGAAPNFLNLINTTDGPNQVSYIMQTNIKLAQITLRIYTRALNLKIPFKFTNIPMP